LARPVIVGADSDSGNKEKGDDEIDEHRRVFILRFFFY
jgi:hypothetical protein